MRVLVVAALASAASVVVGAAADLPLEDSAPLQVLEAAPPPTASPDSGSLEPAPVVDGSTAWVCVVVVDANGEQRLKPGQNPVLVPAGSADARDAVALDHPSYLVDGPDAACEVPHA